ncbi:MAG: type II toxin-antitoxin system PemK/MazF family toxin [Elsteraceae bacterium]
MDRGDIYLVSRPNDANQEGGALCPVLIVTPARFNRVTRTPVVLPIASPESAVRTAGFAVMLEGTGAVTPGVVRCDQPRAIDFSMGEPQKVERAPLAVMDEVMAKLVAILNV